MPFIMITAGIIAGVLFGNVTQDAFIKYLRDEATGASIEGKVVARDATSLTIRTNGGMLVRTLIAPDTLWHTIEHKTTASSTVRAITRVAEPEAFSPETEGRFAFTEQDGVLLLRRAILIL